MLCNLKNMLPKIKMTNSWKTLSILLIISLHQMLSATAQLDDEISLRKLHLQDLEIEQNQREYEREELERLQQQLPPLPLAQHSERSSSHVRPNAQSDFYSRNLNAQVPLQHFIAQGVRPLEQPITAAKPIRPPGVDYASAAASNFNFGINPLTHNALTGDAAEVDIDTDIVTYSHDEAPLPLHLRRPQLELLSAGGAGYTLSSADVLLPPFRDDGVGNFVGDRQHGQQPKPTGLARPLGIGVLPTQVPYNVHELNQSPDAANFALNNRLPDAPTANFKFPNGYLPMNKFGSHNQPIQYGSPQANFRRPNIYTQSKQQAFAPQRPEEATLATSAAKIPFPPSFITLTTQKPEINYVPMAVRPLGRSLGYQSQFRPSAIDPVPDFFAHRQPKSLLDSYIPSWVIAEMLEAQRSNAFARSNGGGNSGAFPIGRQFKRAFVGTAPAQPRKDVIDLKLKSDDDQSNDKVVKKSLDKQLSGSTPEMMMMTA